MTLLGAAGVIFILMGVGRLTTSIKRRPWPSVEGSLYLANVKGEAVSGGEIVGIQAKYIYQVQYAYRGQEYEVKKTSYKMLPATIRLRVNPEKPTEAYPAESFIYPVVSICIGVILNLLALIPNKG